MISEADVSRIKSLGLGFKRKIYPLNLKGSGNYPVSWTFLYSKGVFPKNPRWTISTLEQENNTDVLFPAFYTNLYYENWGKYNTVRFVVMAPTLQLLEWTRVNAKSIQITSGAYCGWNQQYLVSGQNTVICPVGAYDNGLYIPIQDQNVITGSDAMTIMNNQPQIITGNNLYKDEFERIYYEFILRVLNTYGNTAGLVELLKNSAMMVTGYIGVGGEYGNGGIAQLNQNFGLKNSSGPGNEPRNFCGFTSGDPAVTKNRFQIYFVSRNFPKSMILNQGTYYHCGYIQNMQTLTLKNGQEYVFNTRNPDPIVLDPPGDILYKLPEYVRLEADDRVEVRTPLNFVTAPSFIKSVKENTPTTYPYLRDVKNGILRRLVYRRTLTVGIEQNEPHLY